MKQASYRAASLAAAALPAQDSGVRLDWSWQDTEYHDALNSPQIRQSAFHLVRASLACVPPAGRWEVTVAARNLLDETYLVTGNSAFDTAAAYVEQGYGRPRELLLSFGYEF